MLNRTRVAIGIAVALAAVPLLFRTNGLSHLFQPLMAMQQPAPPPDIQKIMDKIRSGQAPTKEEMDKLTAYTLALMQNLPHTQFGPPQTAPADGIPATVSVTGNWTRRINLPGGGSTVEDGRIDVTAEVVLFSTVNGTADYFSNVMNPSAGSSIFRFEPRMVNGRPSGAGTGSMTQRITCKGPDATTTNTTSATLDQTAADITLTTTGGDALFASGAAGGAAHGSVVSSTGRDTTTNPATADAFAGGQFVPFGQENHNLGEKGNRGEMPGASDVRMRLSYKQLVDVIASAKPTTISGTESFSFKDRSGYDVSGDSMIRISFGVPDAPPDLTIAVADTDRDKWKTWLPKLTTEDAEVAKVFGTTARKESDPDPEAIMTFEAKFANGRTCRFDLDLLDVGDLKGTATNYPIDNAQSRKSLFIVAGQKGLDIDPDGQHARTQGDVPSVKFKVASRDMGAWGKIGARCEPLSLKAKDLTTGKGYVNLPRDDDEDHIADQWEEDNNIKGNGALWDKDPKPTGQSTDGDGYTSYEEYRGFVVLKDSGSKDKKWLRTDPQAKDIFIYDRDGLFKTNYEPNNAVAANLTLHYVDLSMMKYDGNTEGPNIMKQASKDHRWVNVNTPDGLWDRRQLSVVVLRDDTFFIAGGAMPDKPDNDDWITTFEHAMNHFYQIRVNVGMVKSNVASLARKAGATLSAKALDDLGNQDLMTTIVHEFGHQIGITHHLNHFGSKYSDSNPAMNWGPLTCAMRYPVLPSDRQLLQGGKKLVQVHFCVNGEMGLYPGSADLQPTFDPCYNKINIKADK